MIFKRITIMRQVCRQAEWIAVAMRNRVPGTVWLDRAAVYGRIKGHGTIPTDRNNKSQNKLQQRRCSGRS